MNKPKMEMSRTDPFTVTRGMPAEAYVERRRTRRCTARVRVLLTVVVLVLTMPAQQGYAGISPEWKLVWRVSGRVESLRADETEWIMIPTVKYLKDGDKVRTLDDSRARIQLADGSAVTIGANTTVEIARFQLREHKCIVELKRAYGRVKSHVQRFLRGESTFETRTYNVVIGAKGTEFAVTERQKIAYVNGADLWIMNEDGTGRTNYIAAPPGKRIGRSAFSPDGIKIAYEVWDCGNDRYPETSDLWIADSDGGNARLLLSAGSLAEPTGKAGIYPNVWKPFTYKARLLWGPCFSPDGSRVSCLRIQFYAGSIPYTSSFMVIREQEIGSVPVAGGSFEPLWTTRQRMPGSWYEPFSPVEYEWLETVGNNTAWSPDGGIVFSRSGGTFTQLYSYVRAYDVSETAWPARLYVVWGSEAGTSPSRLRVTIGGETLDLLPAFKGYGVVKHWFVPTDWCLLTPEEWQTPQTGAVYGPVETRPISDDADTALVESNDGVVSFSFAVTNLVIKGTGHEIFFSGPSARYTARAGAWRVNERGGPAAPFISGTAIGSAAWNSDGSILAADLSDQPSRVNLYNASGQLRYCLNVTGATARYVGNWDCMNQRVTVWSGSRDTGTISVVNVDSGAVTDLGPGEFPAFAPLYRTEVDVFEGSVEVTAANGSHAVSARAGQRVVVDDLANDGLPQAAAIVAPYVVKVIPARGSAVPNNVNPSITFQFSKPVATNTLNSRLITGASWPATAAGDVAGQAVNWWTYAATFHNKRSRSAFNGAVTNVQRRGVGIGSWNEARTEFTFTITDGGFSRADGNWCAVDLDLSGVEDAGGAALGFDSAGTLFQFVQPVGTNGGSVTCVAGGRVTVPPGALGSNTAIGIDYSPHVPGGSGWPAARSTGSSQQPVLLSPPSTETWEQASGVYAITPVTQILAVPVTVSLPLGRAYPNASIWYYDGAAWTNLGGTYDPTSRMLSVDVNHLGQFAIFYRVPTDTVLWLSKSADTATAVAGDEIAYDLLLENLGTAGASNVVVADVLPPALTYQPNSANVGGTFDPLTRTITWSIGNLAGKSRVALEYRARVAGGVTYGTVISNVASVTASPSGATSSAPCVVHVGWPKEAPVRFGIGGRTSTNWPGMAALGASYRRVIATIPRNWAENPNLINFTAFDSQVRSNQAAVMRTYGIVNARPDGNLWPAATDFARAFGRFVERYDGDGMDDMPGLTKPIHEWEIFHEFAPETGQWAGCSTTMYAQYLNAAHAAAHALDPVVTILPSAFVGVPAPGTTNYLQHLVAQHPEAIGAIDAVSFHSHWGLTTGAIGTNRFPQYLEARTVAAFLDGLGLGDRAIWALGDFGWTYNRLRDAGYTCTQADNARFLACSFPYALASGFAHLLYTQFDYDPTQPEWLRWAAVLDAEGNRRMSFYVLQKMIEKLEGFTSAERFDLGDGNIGAKFLVNNQPVWVLWNWSNVTSQASIPVGPVGEARVTGALPLRFDNRNASWAVSSAPVTGGYATVALSGTPIYLEPVGWVDPDLDRDGLPNAEDADLDGDGLPNDYEQAHGLNPFVNDADEDADADGMTNLEEYRAGTDPRLAESVLRCVGLEVTGSMVQVEWQSIPGMTYSVEWSPDLGEGWFRARDGTICAAGTLTRWYDTGPPKTAAWSTNQPIRFYRVKAVVAP